MVLLHQVAAGRTRAAGKRRRGGGSLWRLPQRRDGSALHRLILPHRTGDPATSIALPPLLSWRSPLLPRRPPLLLQVQGNASSGYSRAVDPTRRQPTPRQPDPLHRRRHGRGVRPSRHPPSMSGTPRRWS